MLHLHQLRLQQQQYQQHEQQQQLVVCLQMIPASIQLPSISSALAGGAAQRGFAADSSSHKRGISSLCQQLQEQLNQAAAQLGGTGDNGDAAAAAGTHKHTAQDTPNAGSNAASSSSSSDVYGRHYVDPDADLGFGGGPDGTSATVSSSLTTAGHQFCVALCRDTLWIARCSLPHTAGASV
jgi:Tfp pilus assembly protein FimV